MSVSKTTSPAAITAVAVWLALASVSAQPSAPRTSDGRPDLQGYWDNAIATPLQRPKPLADKEFFSDEEAAAWLAGAIQRVRDTRGEIEVITSGEVNEVYAEKKRLGFDRRTSLIVDPANGLLPELTADGKARAATRTAWLKERHFDNPEDLDLSERCLVWGAGPPMIPSPYNNYLQIVQTRDAVMIANEMIHDVRIVPLDGRPHLPSTIRLWKGDPRGRWDGDTLVVETTNFMYPTTVQGATTSMRVVERFSRTDRDALRYEFTFEDPETFTRPWTAAWTLTSAPGPIYEYACHEGNYSIVNMLKGARRDERTDATAKPK
jgi:hypothetical protein